MEKTLNTIIMCTISAFLFGCSGVNYVSNRDLADFHSSTSSGPLPKQFGALQLGAEEGEGIQGGRLVHLKRKGSYYYVETSFNHHKYFDRSYFSLGLNYKKRYAGMNYIIEF